MFNNLDNNYTLFLLVLTRISAAILFNPFLGKKNIPAITKIGLSLVITVGITPSLMEFKPEIGSFIEFIAVIIKEMLLGFGMGMLIQVFASVVFIAGEAIDMQLGIGMGKIYDPQSNISMSATGSVYNILFTILFFISNGHLTLIKIIVESCRMFPPGDDFFNFKAGSFMFLLFGDVLILALKLALPVIAMELLTEAGLGVLMRIVPQINVFSVGLQVKLAIGFSVVIITLPLISRILDNSVTSMFEKVQEGINIMLSS